MHKIVQKFLLISIFTKAKLKNALTRIFMNKTNPKTSQQHKRLEKLPNYVFVVKNYKISNLEPGDHIYFSNGIIFNHAIYADAQAQTCVYFDRASHLICETHITNFCAQLRNLRVYDYGRIACVSREQIIKNIYHFVGTRFFIGCYLRSSSFAFAYKCRINRYTNDIIFQRNKVNQKSTGKAFSSNYYFGKKKRKKNKKQDKNTVGIFFVQGNDFSYNKLILLVNKNPKNSTFLFIKHHYFYFLDQRKRVFMVALETMANVICCDQHIQSNISLTSRSRQISAEDTTLSKFRAECIKNYVISEEAAEQIYENSWSVQKQHIERDDSTSLAKGPIPTTPSCVFNEVVVDSAGDSLTPLYPSQLKTAKESQIALIAATHYNNISDL
ncbi:hypothetical protein RFI_09283 [Reticulomyxa filosa]|uniref:Uncharacterized protein n=1 Tax=Reticulomyxa filosa TaxID=46433 RepID=X6NPA5_RETFI|nr:hypothetical protein RFI_09283 [Reticulomyxa filosa]|eukprot:ETO27851.1 hypothetical protein RFI_09283 [Reticulomyxa filosa]